MDDQDDLEIIEIFDKKNTVPISQSHRSRLAQRALAIDR